MLERRVICTVCPISCEVMVQVENGEVVKIEGFTCPRGKNYATEEVLDPKRTLTTTVKVSNGELPLLPVRTDKPIPKDYLFNAMKIVCNATIDAPIRERDIIIKDLLGTGANVIASRDLKRAQ